MERAGKRQGRVPALQTHHQRQAGRASELSRQCRYSRSVGLSLPPSLPYGGRHVSRRHRLVKGAEVIFLAVVLVVCEVSMAGAQTQSAATQTYVQYEEPPVMDNTIFYHLLFDQLEGRTNGPDNKFRWEGEGWAGTDMNRLWFKTEGFVEHGVMTDGNQEVLYARPIPYLRYFDVQAGVRYDLDSDPGRTWGAIGLEGLAPYFFQFAPTFYFSNRGFFAGRIEGSYDILITNR